MKAFKLFIVLNGILTIGLMIFYGVIVNQSHLLQKEQNDKRDQMKNIKEAQQKLEAIEREVANLRKEDKGIHDLVSADETKPLTLIKTLTLLGAQLGLKKIEFVSEEKKDDNLTAGAATGAGAAMGPPDKKTGSPAGGLASGNAGKSSRGPTEFTPMFIRMTFEAPYPQLLLFLQKIQTLERIVSIEEIKVNRGEKIFPRQEVTLRLVTYTLMTVPY